VTELTPSQIRARKRIEGLIAAAAPALDLILAVGDRVSRIASPGDREHPPVRAAREPALLEAARRGGANSERAT
jgi:hypothetical protein